MDRPCEAARAASSSRTFSGTSRTVICTLMHAFCQQYMLCASALSANRGGNGSHCPHGVCTNHPDVINANLLVFFKGQLRFAISERHPRSIPLQSRASGAG